MISSVGFAFIGQAPEQKPPTADMRHIKSRDVWLSETRGARMKITAVEDIHANAGWRTLSFLKMTTDTGLVGWSEFNEGRSVPGLTGVIRKMSELVIGQDPRQIGKISTKLYAHTRTASGGMV